MTILDALNDPTLFASAKGAVIATIPYALDTSVVH
jgi:hypothetical protein